MAIKNNKNEDLRVDLNSTDKESIPVELPVSGDFGEKNGMDLAMNIIRKFRDKYNPSNAVMYIKDEETGEIIFYADKEESDKLLKIVSQNSR